MKNLKTYTKILKGASLGGLMLFSSLPASASQNTESHRASGPKLFLTSEQCDRLAQQEQRLHKLNQERRALRDQEIQRLAVEQLRSMALRDQESQRLAAEQLGSRANPSLQEEDDWLSPQAMEDFSKKLDLFHQSLREAGELQNKYAQRKEEDARTLAEMKANVHNLLWGLADPMKKALTSLEKVGEKRDDPHESLRVVENREKELQDSLAAST